MLRRGAKPGLSRKIVANYLLFCLVAVAWLAAGAVTISHAVLDSRTADRCLTRLGSAAAEVEIHLLRHGAAGLSDELARIVRETQAVYGAIIGPDGRVLAHTTEGRVGGNADEPVGQRVEWGQAVRLDYVDNHERTIQEYRTPLIAGASRVGELRLAVEKLNLWSTVAAAAALAPAALLAPLALIAAGAWTLRRMAQPVAQIEDQLRRAAVQPIDVDLEVKAVRPQDALSHGWNRVVDRIAELERRLAEGAATASLATDAPELSDARFEDVLQRLSDGVAVTDATGRIEFANEAVAALLGQADSAAALVGSSLAQRLLAMANEVGRQELQSPGAMRRTAICEVADAERVLRVARLPLGAETAHKFVWSLRDVTQQKLAEQTRDRFIDTATHELRTPLANIKAYAETLATTECIDFDMQREFCNTINSEVTRLARFIDDLLSISSMEVGAISIDRQKTETERLFAEVLSKVEPLMQKKSIAFEASLPPRMPELHLDKDKIIAVIVNVLGNAAKYTPEGGRVSLRVKVEDEKLKIAVEDTGVGISKEELAKVFDKFFRSDDPRVQAETGSGLGLSLAREVVRMHGGEIMVESEINQGSTFTVMLPAT
ncbi:MAG TPA: ATP-binding protein [Lacipirellulaceae bacterium]|nr:ATP-binding protein [Lacipirellulaceae bacterium]